MKIPSSWVHFAQIRKSAGSVVANIAEGNGRRKPGSKYYQAFALIARGSLLETYAWMQLAHMDDILTDEDLREQLEGILILSNKLFDEACQANMQGILKNSQPQEEQID